MRHVDDGRLHAYLDGQLDEVEPGGVDALERHLAGCDACRARLDHARAVRGDADAILAGMLPARLGEVTPAPAFRPAAQARPVRRLRPWVPMAWAASVLLAVSAGWLARRPDAERQAYEGASESVRMQVPPPREAEEAPEEAPVLNDAAEPAAQAAPTAARRAVPEAAGARAEGFSGAGTAGGAARPPVAAPADRVAVAPPPPPPPSPAAPPPAVHAPEASRLATDFSDRVMADSLVLKGQVTDRTGRGVAGAQVRAPGVGASTVTRADGSYALSMPTARLQGRDSVSVRVVRAGMDSESRTLALGTADTLDFQLAPSALALESVVETAEVERRKTGAGAAGAAAPAATRTARPRRPGEWVAVEREEAERLLRHRLLTVPDRPVLGLELGEVDGQAVVRVRQGMAEGKVLSILLRRDSGAPASAAVELERERQGGVTVRQGALLILLSGPFTAESLASYGRRLRP